jgi:hypothetical protein
LDTIVGRQGNDEGGLGVHDANLLYAARGDYVFGSREIDGLVSAGLTHYASQVVPVWYWLSRAVLDRDTLLVIYASTSGVASRKEGALSLMTLIKAKLPSDLPFNRDQCLQIWLSDDRPSATRRAALRYIGRCGRESDVELLRKELKDSQTRGAAAGAIIEIALRHNREAGLDALLELEISGIASRLVSKIFCDDSGLPKDKLLKATTHADSDVRHLAVVRLTEEGSLPEDVARRLLDDPTTAVRYEALVSLVRGGATFSDGEAKRILMSTPRSYGLIGTFSSPGDDAYWKRYEADRLKELSDEELANKAQVDLPLDISAYLMLAERQFSTQGTALRKALKNRYKSEFKEWTDNLSSRIDPETLKKIINLEAPLCKEFTQKSLEVIYRKGASSDVQLVRELLSEEHAEYSKGLVAYLAKYGEWSDIAIIAASIERRHTLGSSLLSAYRDEDDYIWAAKAIYALAKSRFADLILMKMPARLMKQILLVCSDADFRRLGDDAVLELLGTEDDDLRKVATLKCVKSFSRIRVSGLLDTYLGHDRR